MSEGGASPKSPAFDKVQWRENALENETQSYNKRANETFSISPALRAVNQS
jgi:hypothetical protein